MITLFRIIFGILLLFFPVFSTCFYTFYILGGYTDMIDGTIARKTNTISQSGAKLDTIADLIFAFSSFLKIFPAVHLPLWLWIWCALIAIMKIGNIVLEIIVQKKFITQHTLSNKITGFFLFLLPLTLQVINVQYSAPIVCAMATFSAILEAYYSLSGREII